MSNLKLLASPRSAGQKISFADREIVVEEVTEQSFQGVDIAFFSAGGPVSEKYAPVAVKSGAVVIDNTSAFRLDPTVPLVVPEVNKDAIFDHRGIIANPNCSTIIMAVALAPLHNYAKITRVVVSTYQAVSRAGARGIDELKGQVASYSQGQEMLASVLPVASGKQHYPIAFNAIPQIDVFQEDNYTKEEWKMVKETQKIFQDTEIGISVTTVRVPIMRSHCESINIQTERHVTVDKCKELLQNAPGVCVIDDVSTQQYPMPLYTSGKDPVFVGRIRQDKTIANGLNIWVVGDQIRKGAALNAIQIGEILGQKLG